MATLTVDNFSKGITDRYLTPTPGSCKELHNFLLNSDGKPTVRPGWPVFDERVPVSGTNTRISGLYLGPNPYHYPVAFRGASAYRLNADDTFTEILGPESNTAIPNKTANGFENCVLWNKQLVYTGDASTCLPHRIYCVTASEPYAYRALTLGLPALESSPVCTPSGVGSNTYIYAFHYTFEFTDADGTIYEESGPVTFVTVNSSQGPETDQIDISAIPDLVNTSSTNYLVTSTLKVAIYRTVAFGSTFYLLTEQSHLTSTYTDNTADTSITNNEVLYTDGGVLDYNPPLAGTKYVTEVNDFFWYATDRGLYHSIQGAPGACPDEFFTQMAQKCKALDRLLSFPILFCDLSVFRVEGVFDDFGDGGFELKEIDPAAGCVSHRSVVSIPGGLVWAGNGGFYFTDGYQVRKISVHLTNRYADWSNPNIVGAYDSKLNAVFWTINSSANSSVNPNDAIAVLHLDFGISPESTFTTLGSSNNIFPNCLAFSNAEDVSEDFRGTIVIGNASGYLHTFDDAAYCDARVDIYSELETWKKKAITYRYESNGVDLGTDAVRAYLTYLTSEFNNLTDVAAKYESRRDDGGPWASLSEIRTDGAILWDLSDCDWDNDNEQTSSDTPHDFDSQPVIEAKRHFPAGTLRSTRRQVAITNSKTWITNSDTIGTLTVTIDADGNRVLTLDNGSNLWPDDCEEFEVVFADVDGNYTDSYTVKDRVSDTVVWVYDPYATLSAAANLEWQMRGYRKQERLSLLSYTIHFDDDGATQKPSFGQAGLINA